MNESMGAIDWLVKLWPMLAWLLANTVALVAWAVRIEYRTKDNPRLVSIIEKAVASFESIEKSFSKMEEAMKDTNRRLEDTNRELTATQIAVATMQGSLKGPQA